MKKGENFSEDLFVLFSFFMLDNTLYIWECFVLNIPPFPQTVLLSYGHADHDEVISFSLKPEMRKNIAFVTLEFIHT